MKAGRSMFAVGMALVLVGTFVLVGVGAVFAQECRTIRVVGEAAATGSKTLYLEPQTVWLSKGDCAVWFNSVRDVEIMVMFEDGKACRGATASAAGFEFKKMDDVDCYVTNYIKMAGTASLSFVEKGTYAYKVKSNGGATVSGKIIVRD